MQNANDIASILQSKIDDFKADIFSKLNDNDKKINNLESSLENGLIKAAKAGITGIKMQKENTTLKKFVDILKSKDQSDYYTPLVTKDFIDTTAILNANDDVITRTQTNFASDLRLAQNPFVERIPAFDLFTNSGATLIPITGTNAPYVDEVTTGDVAPQLTEGATKAEIDIEYVERVASTHTYAAFIRISDQMLEDINMLQAWVFSMLRRKLQYAYNNAFFNSPGTAGTAQSLDTLSTELVATDFYTGQTVAGISDVINAALTQCVLNNCNPDSVFMNPLDFYKMMSERTTDGAYVDGNANFRTYLFDNPFVVRIWLTNYVPQNTMFVNEIGLVKTIYKANMFGVPEMGLNGQDFTQNMITVRAHVRIENLCPENDKGGLIKVSDIDQAITDLITEPAP